MSDRVISLKTAWDLLDGGGLLFRMTTEDNRALLRLRRLRFYDDPHDVDVACIPFEDFERLRDGIAARLVVHALFPVEFRYGLPVASRDSLDPDDRVGVVRLATFEGRNYVKMPEGWRLTEEVEGLP